MPLLEEWLCLRALIGEMVCHGQSSVCASTVLRPHSRSRYASLLWEPGLVRRRLLRFLPCLGSIDSEGSATFRGCLAREQLQAERQQRQSQWDRVTRACSEEEAERACRKTPRTTFSAENYAAFVRLSASLAAHADAIYLFNRVLSFLFYLRYYTRRGQLWEMAF